MNNVVKHNIIGTCRDFCVRNKKYIGCLLAVFILSFVIGIIITINQYSGGFVIISKDLIVISSVKVFFMSSLSLLIGYIIILLSCTYFRLPFLSLIAFILIGIFFGKYCCVLVGCYGVQGIITLCFIYIPYFLGCLLCMLIGCVSISNSHCVTPTGSTKFHPSLICILKCFAINLILNFIVFLIIGSIVDVIVII